MNTITSLAEVRHSKPLENLVKSSPVKEGTKLSTNDSKMHEISGISWEDLRGLSWTLFEDVGDD